MNEAWMMFLNFRRPILRAPDDPAGNPPAGDPPAGDPPAGDPPAGDPPGGAKWWEGKGFSEDQRRYLTAKGLTEDDPLAVMPKIIEAHRLAENRLGKPADTMIDKPAEGQEVAEWLKSHGQMFGIPEAAEKYEVKPPEDWPKEAQWDSDFETKAREIAFANGVSQQALQAFTSLYAGKAQALMDSAATELASANQELQTTLQKDWGPSYGAKVAQATQAASVLAEAAGLDSEAMVNIAQVLKPQVGDANTIRLFAAVGEMLGEETLQGGNNNPAMTTTPAAARAELDKLQGQGGEWYVATSKNDREAIKRLQPKMDQLRKLAAG